VSVGVILFAHGSRIEAANEAVRLAAAQLAHAGSFDHVAAAFLELGQPDLPGAVAELFASGVRRIVVVPYFLTLGLHMERDLPPLLQDISSKYNDLDLVATPPLEGHPMLTEILLDRIRSADDLGT